MHKLVTALLASSLLMIPAGAEGYEAEIGYSRVTTGGNGVDLDFGSFYGIGGYQWDHTDNYSSSAEVLLAVGVQDDDFFGFGIELTSSFGLGYKGTWKMSADDLELFWRANYTKVNIDAAGAGATVSTDGTGFGIGVGLNWKYLTIGYTSYLGDLDDLDAIHIGFKFR